MWKSLKPFFKAISIQVVVNIRAYKKSFDGSYFVGF
jgi:hypothetical protein